MKSLAVFAAASLILFTGIAQPCLGGQSFVEDFEDGNPTDGSPVSWGAYAAPFDDGTVSVVDGSLVLTPFTSGPPTVGIANYWEIDTFTEDQQYHDVNILTQVRGLTPGAASLVGIGGLDTEATEGRGGSGVWGYLLVDGATQELTIGQNLDSQAGVTRTSPTSLSHVDEELYMRFIIKGLDVSLSAWPVGAPEPLPQVETVLPIGFSGRHGHVTLFAGGGTTESPVAFRFVEVHNDPFSVSPLFVSPVTQYAIRDNGTNGTFDDLGDQAAAFNGLIGEVDLPVDILNAEQRVIEKFSLPTTLALASRLREATLLVSGRPSQYSPAGPLSLYHALNDNDLTQEASDYENPVYVDTQLDVMQPTDTESVPYFAIDVTSFVLADLMNDGENPLSAFRLQVDEAVFFEDNITHAYSISTPTLRLRFDSTSVGDFSGDGTFDVTDVDLLTRQIASSTNEPEFDITGDGLVNTSDLARWLWVAAGENGFAEPYVLGDTNLDGIVDFTDFVNLNNNWQATELTDGTPVAWSSGDFDGDGIVAFADFVVQNNNWQRSIASAGGVAVPEPSAFAQLAIGGMLLWRRQPRVGSRLRHIKAPS